MSKLEGVKGKKPPRELEEEGFEYNALSCRGTVHSSLVLEGWVIPLLTPRFSRQPFDQLSQFESDGGSLLYVPPGKWLTGSSNLMSHFTMFLFLEKDAVLMGSQLCRG